MEIKVENGEEEIGVGKGKGEEATRGEDCGRERGGGNERGRK